MAPSVPLKIGLLGGAFNPAHEGHVHISQCAKTMLGLDEVWWLVAYDHPTKTHAPSEDFKHRFTNASTLAAPYSFIKVSDFEYQAKTRYTIDTVTHIKEAHPNVNFIWLIGADNLTTLHLWHRWREIITHLPIAVFDRGHDKIPALSSPFSNEFSSLLLRNPKQLATTYPYHWTFLNNDKHPASSTALRAKLKSFLDVLKK